jgi:glutathione S-transferase
VTESTDIATLLATRQVQLVIGNKNYSSWSMRGWLLLRKAGVNFQEVPISFGDDGYRTQLLDYSPSGRVPVVVLRENGRMVGAIWDSLAIAESVAELCPRLWPRDPWARAEARSIAAEMHAGFPAIRSRMPLNCRAVGRQIAMDSVLQGEIERIGEIWADRHRRRLGTADSELDIADLMYVPVASRFRTYGIELDEDATHHQTQLLDDPDVKQWHRMAEAESEVLATFEIGA